MCDMELGGGLEARRAKARLVVGLTPEIRRKLLEVFAEHGVADVRIFGSVAKGTAKPESDIDFLASFPPGFGLFALAALQDELEEVVGRPVDLVSDDPRASRVVEEIRRTAIPL